MKKTFLKKASALLISVLLILSSLAGCGTLKSSAKSTFLKTNATYDSILNEYVKMLADIDFSDLYQNQSFESSSEILMGYEGENAEIFNSLLGEGILADMSVKYDKKNQRSLAEFTLGEFLLNTNLKASVYSDNSKVVIEIPEVLSKPIFVEAENKEVINYYDKYSKIFQNLLLEEYFVSEAAEETFGDKQISVTNITLDLTKDRIMEIYKGLAAEIENDESIMAYIQSLIGEDTAVKAVLAQAELELSKIDMSMKWTKYISGKDVLGDKITVSIDDETVEVLHKLYGDSKKKDGEFRISSDSENAVKATYSMTSNGKESERTLSIKVPDSEEVRLSSTSSDGETELSFSTVYDGEKSVLFTLKTNAEKMDKNTTKLTTVLEQKQEYSSDILKVTLDNVIKYSSDITIAEKSISAESAYDLENQDDLTALGEEFANSSIFGSLLSSFGGYDEYDYDDYEDYDYGDYEDYDYGDYDYDDYDWDWE